MFLLTRTVQFQNFFIERLTTESKIKYENYFWTLRIRVFRLQNRLIYSYNANVNGRTSGRHFKNHFNYVSVTLYNMHFQFGIDYVFISCNRRRRTTVHTYETGERNKHRQSSHKGRGFLPQHLWGLNDSAIYQNLFK